MQQTHNVIFFAILICYLLDRGLAKDYYAILEVPRDASERQIQKSFHGLARKWHPDVNPGNDEAAKKYIEINKAYEVMKDPSKKRDYDMFGDPEERNNQVRMNPGHASPFPFGNVFGNGPKVNMNFGASGSRTTTTTCVNGVCTTCVDGVCTKQEGGGGQGQSSYSSSYSFSSGSQRKQQKQNKNAFDDFASFFNFK